MHLGPVHVLRQLIQYLAQTQLAVVIVVAKYGLARVPAVLSFRLILSFFPLPLNNHLTGKVLPSLSECCSLGKLLDPAIAN